MIILGIDPAFRKGGFATCLFNTEKKTLSYKSFDDVFDFDIYLRLLINTHTDLYVAIENSNTDHFMFVKKSRSESEQVFANRCIKVGKNMAISEQVSKQCVKLLSQRHVKEYSPKQKGAKETTVIEYERRLKKHGITDIYRDKRGKGSNQDERDAFKLASLLCDELEFANKYYKNRVVNENK